MKSGSITDSHRNDVFSNIDGDIITIEYHVDETQCWFELRAKHNDWLWGYVTESTHIALPNVTDAKSFVNGLKQLAYQRAYKRA